jgi:ERCC4-type nuclease
MTGRSFLAPDPYPTTTTDTPGGSPADPLPPPVESPFVVLIDTREQHPYTFDRTPLWAGPANRSARIIVRTQPAALKTGDYGLQGWSGIAVERKSKEDLYGSISQRRENFVERLERMEDEHDYSAVVVEAEWAELLSNPPKHSQFSPKSLTRTIIAWRQRYRRVDWWFLPSRDHAEAFTYRIIERYYLDHKGI